jgi:hypothetical protein
MRERSVLGGFLRLGRRRAVARRNSAGAGAGRSCAQLSCTARVARQPRRDLVRRRLRVTLGVEESASGGGAKPRTVITRTDV